MAGSVSPATGGTYGVARVCRIWEEPRSGFHLARRLAQDPPPVRPEGRRGPKPEVSDAAMLAAIRADLARSPWSGPGRARGQAEKAGVRGTAAPPNASSGRGCGTGSRVARKRVLRLMRKHALLSPHWARMRPASEHDRTIVTNAPNVMWATDGTRITTVRDGKVRRFATVEPRGAEALGSHVAKRGTRREALQATGLSVRAPFGHPGRNAARGVQLRHDHGSGFMADDFRTRIRARGAHDAALRFRRRARNERRRRAVLPHPEGELVHGRVYETIEDVREAVRACIARTNAAWLVEKNGHLSPATLRRQHELAAMPMAA
jgi:hypothetical protein